MNFPTLCRFAGVLTVQLAALPRASAAQDSLPGARAALASLEPRLSVRLQFRGGSVESGHFLLRGDTVSLYSAFGSLTSFGVDSVAKVWRPGSGTSTAGKTGTIVGAVLGALALVVVAGGFCGDPDWGRSVHVYRGGRRRLARRACAWGNWRLLERHRRPVCPRLESGLPRSVTRHLPILWLALATNAAAAQDTIPGLHVVLHRHQMTRVETADDAFYGKYLWTRGDSIALSSPRLGGVRAVPLDSVRRVWTQHGTIAPLGAAVGAAIGALVGISLAAPLYGDPDGCRCGGRAFLLSVVMGGAIGALIGLLQPAWEPAR